MALLSAVLLVVWLVGIAYTAYSVVHFVKNGEGDLHEQFTTVLESHPGPILAILTVLTVFWPATLVVSIARKRK